MASTRRTTMAKTVFAVAALLCAPYLRALIITVNSSADCDTAGCDGGKTTLREAIESINAGADINADVVGLGSYSSSFEQIQFSYGSYPQTITLGSPLPTVTDGGTLGLFLDGPGAAADLTISGNDLYRVFFVNGSTVEISNLTIAHGRSVGGKGGDAAAGGGGGGAGLGAGLFVNSGTVTISRVIFYRNTVTGGGGGGGGGPRVSLRRGGGGGGR